MSIVAIYLNRGEGAPMAPVNDVRAVAGHGLEGNRPFGDEPGGIEPDQEVTLIEIEAVESLPRDWQIPFEPAESRRNLVTRGVSLNDLVGREFRVGGATLAGIRLCEPCRTLERLTRPGVLKALVHRGGLRARIVESGAIRVGDAVSTDVPQPV